MDPTAVAKRYDGERFAGEFRFAARRHFQATLPGKGFVEKTDHQTKVVGKKKRLTASDFVGPVAAVDLSIAAQSDGDASLVPLALKLAGLARLDSCKAFNQTDDSRAKNFHFPSSLFSFFF